MSKARWSGFKNNQNKKIKWWHQGPLLVVSHPWFHSFSPAVWNLRWLMTTHTVLFQYWSGKNQLVYESTNHYSQGDQCNPGHDSIWRPGLLRLWLTALTKIQALGEVHQKLCVTTQIKSSVLHVPVQVALDYSSFWGLLCYPCSTAKIYSWVQQPWPYFLTLISDEISVLVACRRRCCCCFIFILSYKVFCLHICLCIACMPSTWGGHKRTRP